MKFSTTSYSDCNKILQDGDSQHEDFVRTISNLFMISMLSIAVVIRLPYKEPLPTHRSRAISVNEIYPTGPISLYKIEQ